MTPAIKQPTVFSFGPGFEAGSSFISKALRDLCRLSNYLWSIAAAEGPGQVALPDKTSVWQFLTDVRRLE